MSVVETCKTCGARVGQVVEHLGRRLWVCGTCAHRMPIDPPRGSGDEAPAREEPTPRADRWQTAGAPRRLTKVELTEELRMAPGSGYRDARSERRIVMRELRGAPDERPRVPSKPMKAVAALVALLAVALIGSLVSPVAALIVWVIFISTVRYVQMEREERNRPARAAPTPRQVVAEPGTLALRHGDEEHSVAAKRVQRVYAERSGSGLRVRVDVSGGPPLTLTDGLATEEEAQSVVAALEGVLDDRPRLTPGRGSGPGTREG